MFEFGRMMFASFFLKWFRTLLSNNMDPSPAINMMCAYCTAGTEGQQIATFVIGGLKRGNINGTDF
jgi:hypothetical protein